MKNLRYLLIGFFTVFYTQYSFALENKNNLQQGATFFMNYCSACHSLQYLRYHRMTEDLGLMPGYSTYDPILSPLPLKDAKNWFGLAPPDLSLTAKEKGATWLYAYLKGFYKDESQPFGTNNVLVPNVAMPNILESLSGIQIKEPHSQKLIVAKKGELSAEEFDEKLKELVAFLVYTSDPSERIRPKIGLYALIFLTLLFAVVYKINKIYNQH